MLVVLEIQPRSTAVVEAEVPVALEEIMRHQEQQVLVEQELNCHQLSEIHSLNQIRQQVVD
jgi:hypothetical protein